MEKWIETETNIETVNWKGEPLQITKVKAFKNPKTGEVMVYPEEVAKAEIRQIAEDLDICPRDVGTLLMLLAQPRNFNKGDVFYKYHLQKMMFYLWKSLEQIYDDSLLLDKFIGAENGPVPEKLNDDLERFQKSSFVKVKNEKCEQGVSKRILLTEEGTKVAEEVWRRLPDPYKEIALQVKEMIYAKSPEEVRHKVHNEFPEYKDTYIKNDIE